MNNNNNNNNNSQVHYISDDEYDDGESLASSSSSRSATMITTSVVLNHQYRGHKSAPHQRHVATKHDIPLSTGIARPTTRVPKVVVLSCFERSARLTRDIGSEFIKKQAMDVKRKLSDVIPLSNKRSKLSQQQHGKTQLLPAAQQVNPQLDEEHYNLPALGYSCPSGYESILEQAERTKRMSILLRNIEVLNGLFHKELSAACCDEDGNYNGDESDFGDSDSCDE